MQDQQPQPIAIAVLAKAPLPGQVNTRLEPVLGAVGAAVLQARFIERAVATACAATVGPVTLWTSPDETHPAFREAASRQGVALARQCEGDLGARMLAAITHHAPAIVIGADCPALTPDHIRLAADILRARTDAVVIPADDGGYVLIGLQQAQPQVFADIVWGTDTVMFETRRRFVKLGLSWREPARLWDVDRPEDLARLREAGLASLIPALPA
jgi:rSAM/selenodomain-associated transferase 1